MLKLITPLFLAISVFTSFSFSANKIKVPNKPEAYIGFAEIKQLDWGKYEVNFKIDAKELIEKITYQIFDQDDKLVSEGHGSIIKFDDEKLGNEESLKLVVTVFIANQKVQRVFKLKASPKKAVIDFQNELFIKDENLNAKCNIICQIMRRDFTAQTLFSKITGSVSEGSIYIVADDSKSVLKMEISEGRNELNFSQGENYENFKTYLDCQKTNNKSVKISFIPMIKMRGETFFCQDKSYRIEYNLINPYIDSKYQALFFAQDVESQLQKTEKALSFLGTL